MKHVVHPLIFCLTAAMAALLYAGVAQRESRYDFFDLVRQRPILAQAKGASPTLRAQPIDLNNTGVLEQVNGALADLTDAVVPSVVSIDTRTSVDVRRIVPADPFGFFGFRTFNERYESPGLGSGVIVSEEGHIVTNHHVVAGVDQIQVTLHDGAKYSAEWVGSEPGVDVAVLRIVGRDGEELPRFQPLAFGDSDTVRVGEMVLAVGNPFGLSETVTRGIISAKQRQLSDGANEYFQVDAVINPGNSGGPLVNVRGEIIGINVAIFTGQEDVRVWQGIGLAIPANDARSVFEAIVHGRPLIRGYLGLGLRNVSTNYAIALGLNSTKGALVTNVDKGSPAESAGLKPGDVIVRFDGKAVRNAEDTLARIRLKKQDEPAVLSVVRKGEAIEVKATATAKSDTNSIKLRSDITATGQSITEALGIEVRDLTAREREAVGLNPDSPAILITDVKSGSQAERRFLPGDLVHYINRDPVESVAQFYDMLGSLPTNRPSSMVLSRDGRRITAVLNP